MALSTEEVLKQSEAAFAQWGETWEKHAIENGKIYQQQKTSHKDILFEGLGKTLLCLGYGPSFEENIETIKKYKNNVDIGCVDKCIGRLLDNNIIPKYVFLADAGVSYEKWLEPWIDQTENIWLITNVTANVEWTKKWKGKIFFYVNKDNISTEKIYSPLSGVCEQIPASSNVSNSAVVFSTQVLGYDEILLCGYDYSWKADGNYYAFNAEDDLNIGKRYWMKHSQSIDVNGNLVNTSQNLLFSSKWLADFYQSILGVTRTQLYNCSNLGLLNIPSGKLDKKMATAKQRLLTNVEKNIVVQKRADQVLVDGRGGNDELNRVLKSGINIHNIIINHISKDTIDFLEAR